MSAPPGRSNTLGTFGVGARENRMSPAPEGALQAQFSAWTPQERFVVMATERSSSSTQHRRRSHASRTSTWTTAPKLGAPPAEDASLVMSAAAACNRLLRYAQRTDMCMQGIWVAPHPRIYTMLPRKASVCCELHTLRGTLCDMSFLAQAIRSEGLPSLLDTIDVAQTCLRSVLAASPAPLLLEPEYSPGQTMEYLTQLGAFLRRNSSTLIACPQAVTALAANAEGHVSREAAKCIENAQQIVLRCELQWAHAGAVDVLAQQDEDAASLLASDWRVLMGLRECGYADCLQGDVQRRLALLIQRLGAFIQQALAAYSDVPRVWNLQTLMDEKQPGPRAEGGHTADDSVRMHVHSSMQAPAWKSVTVFVSCPSRKQSAALRAYISAEAVIPLQAACTRRGVELEWFDLERVSRATAMPTSAMPAPQPSRPGTAGASALVLLELSHDSDIHTTWEGHVLMVSVPLALLVDANVAAQSTEEGGHSGPPKYQQEGLQHLCGVICAQLWKYIVGASQQQQQQDQEEERGQEPGRDRGQASVDTAHLHGAFFSCSTSRVPYALNFDKAGKLPVRPLRVNNGLCQTFGLHT
jgi:hypothetical protein